MLAVREFSVPPLILTGSGASEQVGEQCSKRGLQKALIVTDETIRSLGVVTQIEQALSQSGIAYSIYDGVATEPVVEFVEAGLEMYRDDGCDFLLAVGGGSPIDTAKAIAVLTTNEGSISDYRGIGKIAEKGAPLVALRDQIDELTELVETMLADILLLDCSFDGESLRGTYKKPFCWLA